MQVDPPATPAGVEPKKKAPRKPRAKKPANDQANLTVGPPPTPEVESTPGASVDTTPEVPTVAAPEVDESVIRTMLKSLSNVASFTIGNDEIENHWRFTDREIDDISPPLTRMINRRPAARAAVVRGDEASVALVLASYTGRNLTLSRKFKTEQEKKKREQQPETDRATRTMGSAGNGGTTQPGRTNGGHGFGISPTTSG